MISRTARTPRWPISSQANAKTDSGAGVKTVVGPAAVVALCLALLVIAMPVAAAGSWAASAPSVRVSMADRESRSAPLQPPASVSDGEIVSVAWRFNIPPGANLRARLCQAATCLAMTAMRGHSRALAGLPATQPLRFHFSLAPGQDRAVTVQGLQLIVNYL